MFFLPFVLPCLLRPRVDEAAGTAAVVAAGLLPHSPADAP